MGWAARANHRSDEFAALSSGAQALVQAQKSREFAAASPEAEELADQQRLRECAAQIKDEAQLQKILDDVRPQSIRADVEASIRPWCTFTWVGEDAAGDDLPIVRVTPTDEAGAEHAALLEAAINRDIHTVLEFPGVQPADPESFARHAARLDDLDTPGQS